MASIFSVTVKGYDSSVLYAHAETTTVGGSYYYLFKSFSADGPATVLSASAATTGRKLMGKWVYSLSGVESIPVSTWTITYRAMKSASASYVVAHCDIDISIIKGDGTIRSIIATNVANSPNINLVNTWMTLTGTYNWPGYIVVNQTDYLEIDFYIEVTNPQSSKYVKLLVDDPTLPLTDQTKVEGVVFVLANQPPVATFTYSPSSPFIYETVTFDASASYDPDGSIVSYTWDFGDGNITTVTEPIITHFYTTATSTVNYTVTLTVVDNGGMASSTSQIVPLTNPSILHVTLPEGVYSGSNPDHWLDECWLLNINANSGTFTLRINNTNNAITSYDTHLIVALNDEAYSNLIVINVDGVTVQKGDFKFGEPKPYNVYTWPSGDVYPTWFNDTLINVGTIPPKGYVDVTVHVSFSDATNTRIHFDAYGSKTEVPPPPNEQGKITHNPLSQDSTVQFFPPPIIQYYLTVKTDPEGIVAIQGEGWYDEGTEVTLLAPDPVPGSTGVRYKFSYWDVDGTPKAGNPITVLMDANHTATAHYTLEYYLTVISPFGIVGGEGWYPGGATAYATLNTGLIDHGNGTRRVFLNWGGDASGTNYAQSNPIIMDAPKTATANWKTQYYLSLSTYPFGVTTPTGEGWCDAGTYAAISTPEYVPSGSRYRFVQWTTANMAEITDPYSPSTTVLVDEPKTVTANYVHQYLVTFSQTGLDSDASGTVVTVNGSSLTYSSLPYSIWVDENAVITYSYESIVSSTVSGKRFALISVTGPLSPITVTTDITIIGNYKIQYYLEVSSAYGSPSPTSGWYDAGSSITASISSPASGPTGTRYICTGWTGTGSVPASGTGTSVTFTLNAPSSITWNWKTQYLLTVVTDPMGLSPQPTRNPAGEVGTANSWWYDADTSVTLTAQTVASYNFNYWDVNGASQGSGINPITVVVNAPKTATAHYTAAPPLTVSISPTSASILIGQQVTFTSTVSGGTAPYIYQWYVNNQPVPGATSSSFTFMPTATGTYYVMLKVTDAAGNPAQSDPARVTVSSVPVGGYSVALTKNTPITPIAYTMLMALFASLLSLTKRKRK